MKKNKGFTLLELLIVIAIVGLLVSIVVGSIKNSKKTPKERCLEKMEVLTIKDLPVACLKYTGTEINLIKN